MGREGGKYSKGVSDNGSSESYAIVHARPASVAQTCRQGGPEGGAQGFNQGAMRPKCLGGTWQH